MKIGYAREKPSSSNEQDIVKIHQATSIGIGLLGGLQAPTHNQPWYVFRSQATNVDTAGQ